MIERVTGLFMQKLSKNHEGTRCVHCRYREYIEHASVYLYLPPGGDKRQTPMGESSRECRDVLDAFWLERN